MYIISKILIKLHPAGSGQTREDGMKKTYYGYYSINHGQTYNRDPYEYSNLREARSDMRAIARGNCPAGSRGAWWITDSIDSDSCPDDITVASGRV